MHVIKQLAREQTVLCRGNKWFHLCGRTGKQDGQIAFLYFPVFLVGTPVVRQTVMVERFAERVAPVSVFRADGSRNSICFRFADKSCALASMIFCRIPVPVLLPEMRNILFLGIWGASTLLRSFPMTS